MVIATGKSRERRKPVVCNKRIKKGYAGAYQREDDLFNIISCETGGIESLMSKPRQAARPQKIYSPPILAALAVIEREPDYLIPCPKCEKRTMDVYEMPANLIRLRYKCPHCRNVIVIPLAPIEKFKGTDDVIIEPA